MNTSTYFVSTISFIFEMAMKLITIFEIKIYQKLPNFLTGFPYPNTYVLVADFYSMLKFHY